ncbi:MAG: hypothetical protein WD034_01095, partial [Parvibaculum sp.]
MKSPAIALGMFALVSPAFAVDERYRAYEPAPGLAGTVEAAADPANARLMLLWREGFAARHPAARIAPLDAAASDALTARAAVEALAVFVHRDNPLSCLPLDGLATLFAGAATWGDAGLEGDWAARPVVVFDRPAGSERDFFAAAALKGGEIAPDAKIIARASALMREIGVVPGGIGYAPAGYRSDAVRALKLSDGGECAGQREANAHRAAWPLARIVRLVARGPAARNMIDYVLSQEGQRDAV